MCSQRRKNNQILGVKGIIADSAEEGWKAVGQRSDGECIRQAEARAYQKHRRAQSQRKITSQRSLYSTLSSVPFNSPTVVHYPGPFISKLQHFLPLRILPLLPGPEAYPPSEDLALPKEGLAIFEATILSVRSALS